jgi:polar amino acid transport system substrate-binding protein
MSYKAWLLVAALLGPVAAAAQTLHFVTEPFPPYTYANEQGQAAGPMVEVLRAACKQLGWQCPIEVLPWRRALNMAQRGEVEGIFTVVDSPERRQYFHVTPAVVEARYAFFAKSGNPLQYTGERGVLEGHRIGAYGPSATALTLEQLVEGLARVRTEIEPDNRTVLRKLAAGRYGEDGLALANEAVAQHLIREERLPGLISVGVAKSFGYAFGLNRQNVELAQAQSLGRVLYELCRSGRTQELLRPFGLPASGCGRPQP